MLRPLSEDVQKSLEEATTIHERNQHLALPYLAGRAILPATVVRFRLGLVTSTESMYAGRLSIPSIGPNGAVQSLRFRCLAEHDCGEVDCQKYLGMSGVPTRLFNTRAVRETEDIIAITSGELDAVILNQIGLPAVAVTGDNNWKEHHPRIFTGFSQVIVVADNDKAGQAFGAKVRRGVLSARVVTLEGDAKEDVNSFFVRCGEDALRKALGLPERTSE